MFGCLRRLGCLVVLGFLGALLWLNRDRLPFRWARGDVTAGDTLPTWQPIDRPSATRGERAVRALAGRRGPVYVNLRPGELASYAFLSLSDALPPALRDAQTSVIGDRVYLRAVVSPRDFAGVLGGPFGGMLGQRDTLRLGGTFDVVRPGLAEFRVRDVQLGAFPLPAAVVPRLVAHVRQGHVPAGVAADALPVPVPDYVGDVRVARGRITLYRATP